MVSQKWLSLQPSHHCLHSSQPSSHSLPPTFINRPRLLWSSPFKYAAKHSPQSYINTNRALLFPRMGIVFSWDPAAIWLLRLRILSPRLVPQKRRLWTTDQLKTKDLCGAGREKGVEEFGWVDAIVNLASGSGRGVAVTQDQFLQGIFVANEKITQSYRYKN